MFHVGASLVENQRFFPVHENRLKQFIERMGIGGVSGDFGNPVFMGFLNLEEKNL